MESFMKWYYNLASQVKWKFAFAHFHFLDLFFILFLILGLGYGIKKGLLRLLVQTLELILVMWLVLGNYESSALILRRIVPLLPSGYLQFSSFFILLSVIWAAVLIVDSTVQRWVSADTVGFLRITGGGIMGVIYFLLIFSVMSKGLTLLPIDAVKRLYDGGNSTFGHFAKELGPSFYNSVTKILGVLMREKS